MLTENELQKIKEIQKIKKKYLHKKDYFGCIPILGDDDVRIHKYHKQYQENGFDDTVTWNLANEVSRFLIPRLKRFKEVNIAYPGDGITYEQWNEIIDRMIYAHEVEIIDSPTDEQWEKHKEGMELFHKYYRNLWW